VYALARWVVRRTDAEISLHHVLTQYTYVLRFVFGSVYVRKGLLAPAYALARWAGRLADAENAFTTEPKCGYVFSGGVCP